jgi:hypothetical protein
MFNLESEVQAWCESIHHGGSDRQVRIDELADHLHCEVAHLVEQGQSEQTAFLAATNQMGEAQELVREHSKNQSMTSRTLAISAALFSCNSKKMSRLLDSNQRALLLILVSLFFAGLMLLGSWLSRGTENSQTVTYALIAVWFIPFSVLSNAEPNDDKGSCAEKA